jgi:peptide/nickel transport system substrate-binding protein
MDDQSWIERTAPALRRRVTRRGALALGGTAAFLAACGGGEKETSTSSSATTAPGGSSPAAAAASGAPAGQGKVGGTLRYPLHGISSGDPPTLYPYENLTYLTQNPSSLHYSRMLRGQSGPDIGISDNSKLEGDLAAKLPEQPDELTYIFTLKPNIKFHDKPPLNGRAANAQDFLKSWDVFRTSSQSRALYTDVIERMEATDDKTIKVSMKSPFAPFQSELMASAEGLWFIPVETIDNKQVQTDPVGTGPFIFRQWDHGVAMRWDRNPTYYDTPIPYAARVEGSLNGDPQRILAGLQSGDLDLSDLAGSLFEDAKRKLDPKGQQFFDLPQGCTSFYFNFDNKPFGDKRVRQALSMALDRDGYLKVQDQTGKGDWYSFIPPAHTPFFMSPRTEQQDWGPNGRYFKRDIAEAKKLLAAAGFPDGLPFKLWANVDRYGAQAKQAWELFAQTISEAGFRAELSYQDYGSYIQSIYLGKIPDGCAVGPLTGNLRDPDQAFFGSYSSQSARHQWGGTPIPEMADLDARFAKQRRLLNLNERVAEIKELQRVMADSMLVVPTHAVAGFKYSQPWVQNLYWKTSYAIHAESFARLWFTDERIKKG